MKAKEKRIIRGYKCAETPYRKAMRRAKRDKTTLAAIIENIVTAYGNGAKIEWSEIEKISLDETVPTTIN
jgi:hypothetical protein